MSSIKSFLITLSAFALLASCTATSRVCMTPEATNSVICPTLAKVSLTPESANLMFKLANIEAIRANIYAKKDVLAFFNSAEALLEDATYMSLASYVIFEIAKINTKYQLEMVLITQSFAVFQTTNIPINEFDKNLILTHIKQQKQLLALVN